tara:strand:+ start:2254 stop:2562 length:309 start_codon:yes stop_codon:yes gene_type:complete
MWNDAYSTEQNQFDRLGHPGIITTVYTYTGGQVDFTGSMYGYGALKVITHADATASLSGGGNELPLSDFATSAVVYPLSVNQIKGAAAGAARIYVFKVQGTV